MVRQRFLKRCWNGGVRRENRKAYVDKMAAAFILQTYMDRINREQKLGDQIGGKT